MKKPLLITVSATILLTLLVLLIISSQGSAKKEVPTDRDVGEMIDDVEDKSPADPEQTLYTCPEEKWVNCMPTIYNPEDPEDVARDRDRRAMCSESYLKWAKENCPGFEGAAY